MLAAVVAVSHPCGVVPENAENFQEESAVVLNCFCSRLLRYIWYGI